MRNNHFSIIDVKLFHSLSLTNAPCWSNAPIPWDP